MFDFLRRSPAEDPAPATVGEPVTSPVEGSLVPLSEVPDPVFSGGLVGPGFAVAPEKGTFRAPIAGTVVTLPETLHAVGIRSAGGVEVLVHVGVDSVTLKGEGFTARCREGQSVSVGDPILEVDLGLVGSRIPSLLTPVVVTSLEGFDVSEPDLRAAPGSPVVTVRPS